MDIEHLLSHISTALRIPVLVLAVVALGVVVAEVGALAVELIRRRRRSLQRLEASVADAREALKAGDVTGAQRAIRSVAVTRDMAQVLSEIVVQLPLDRADERIAKRLADYDHRQLRRLERTRILVRVGPALGLMGTLIPLTPALSGLAKGNLAQLTTNLQVAFSVTVAGLLVGAVAFAISLVRDRLYSHDYSDVQYVAATLTDADLADVLPDTTGPATTASVNSGEIH